MTGWVQQGVESFFATQRVLVDLAMRQNALAMKSFRDMLTDPDNSPVAILTELAVEGTSNFIEAQQILLNLAQQENDIILNGVKERVGGSSVGTAATDLLRRAINNYVDMQQEYLKITKKQAINWLDAVKDGKGYDGSHMVELAREGMENFVHSQKKFLDIILEETNKATSGKPRTEKIKKTELSKLAQNGVTAFIDAQKKLLDVAGQQMNVNLKSATKSMNMLSPARLLPMAHLTGEGVRSFVEAEKAMIDSVVKPRNGEKPRPKPRAKAAGRRNKAAMAHAAA
jgi:hypothetical protein